MVMIAMNISSQLSSFQQRQVKMLSISALDEKPLSFGESVFLFYCGGLASGLVFVTLLSPLPTQRLFLIGRHDGTI
jgi:hypothetical protein